ncbi:Protein TRANSPARENT TESTA GLABRA 1 [Tritrichomonas foetus]|uniref:Protein TRANSPARENT TESTA GLABRA 1 n=1 Tax=Tritrichomonas foetus TaxID=1144522 RepID=A0A1J4JKD3_9EUKA|nr:Protein TRANSPARENT TESTA GLABRA 1 [Tritrichomonas foetus]|eukprot:OHS99073.1 Protein TRANSPARENT TESTA GLABRA 1 [Tritrichomonas foetus]
MAMQVSFLQSAQLPWQPYSMCFSSSFSIENRLAISSFSKSSNNWLKIIRIVGPSAINESVIPVSFPQVSMCFSPVGSHSNSDLLITAADTVKLWQTNLEGIQNISTINVNAGIDPITCLDWSIFEESLSICGSTDGTISALDLGSSEVVSRIVAHDHPIFDISFCGSTPSFVTAGFEGSIRFFDLRDLQSSFIFYQTAMPILRVSVSSIDTNKIASFAANSKNIVVVDARNPGIPLNVLKCSEKLTSIRWSQLSPNIVHSTDATGNILETNIEEESLLVEPTTLYSSNEIIQTFVTGQGICAISGKDRVDLLSFSRKQRRHIITEEELGQLF